MRLAKFPMPLPTKISEVSLSAYEVLKPEVLEELHQFLKCSALTN